jgi:uncharacterized protein with NRDE domain
MCLFSIIYQTIPGCPVLVFANREDSPDRPSAPPAVYDSPAPNGRWLGGCDLLAGGTWLGVNAFGLIVAVTNRRKTPLPAHPKSRGLLCRELLEQGSWKAAIEEFHCQWNAEKFAGFNLMLVSREQGRIFSAGDHLREQPLTPGLHAVTNRDWNDPDDKRIARVRELMAKFQRENPGVDDWLLHAKTICGLGEDVGGDAVCIPCRQGWGTVSSSIIALTDEPANARYLHAAGSPAVTAYDDYSPQLISQLEESQ